jgi:glycosyltransferase involved in cell wall biosynthesis
MLGKERSFLREETPFRKSNPLVSAVISTYNSERFMRGRLHNLIEQTIFPEIEIVVVNSGSQQNEESIVKEFQGQYPNIVYVSTPQRETIYRAWNRGISVSRGKYITNANTDDRLRRDALEVLANALDAHPNVAMVYGDQYITSIANSSYEKTTHRERFFRSRYSRLKLFSEYLLGSHPLWRASLHSDGGIWFDEKYEVAGDYDFAFRVAEHFEMLYVPEVLGVYYRPVDRSNKEFQNAAMTDNETNEIRAKYMRRFLSSLTKEEFERLYCTMRFWSAVPTVGFSLLHRGMMLTRKEKVVLHEIFWCWFGSQIEESRGNLKAAKRLCLRMLSHPDGGRIRYQYDHLLKVQSSE